MPEEKDIVSLMESALTREYELYQQLFFLSQQQMGLLRNPSPDTEQVARLMDQKMNCLSEIRNLEEADRPIKGKWEKEHQQCSSEQRHRISQCVDTVTKLIEQLKELEDEIAESIKRCEREVNQQLKALYKGRAVTRAYFEPNPGFPRIIDKWK